MGRTGGLDRVTWDKILWREIGPIYERGTRIDSITDTEKQIVEDAEAKLLGLAARMLPAYSYSAAWDCTY